MSVRTVLRTAGLPFLVAGCVLRHPTEEATPASSAGTSRPPAAQTETRPRGRRMTAADSARLGLANANGIRPYASVITKDAKTRTGLFTTHRIGDRLYFEIPHQELDKDMLLVGRYARAAAMDASNPYGAYGGDQFGERTLRWERNGHRIILRSPSFAIMADTSLPVYRAVEAGNYAPIIAIFDVATYGPDSSAVIDVTRLFTTTVTEFSALRGQIDPSRSYVENALAFPDNVEIEATQTGTVAPPQPNYPYNLNVPRGPAATQSVLAHWSIVRLPEHPMMPRLSDDRVGYFGLSRTDFGTTEYHSVEKRYIARWRLEKKDPNAALSEPVQPIVYYIDPATPDQWKPWIRKAILDWQPAFEAAGFKNAIIAKDPPTNDPDWSPDDIRHTVIRWLPSTTENAVGPHISDPRTGEILNGSIRLFHNVLNLQRDWYFTQVAPLDPRAQQWPMPDSLMGRLLEFVVAHEIGHTLGLYHNHKASSMYPADSVRSATWVHRMGHSPSIMDYARYNYVAQPEDHIALDDLIPRLGPYDLFAIKWGYAPIPSAHTPEAERPILDQWAREQDSIPWLRFGHASEVNASNNPDAGDQTEAVGDADPVKSTGYGLKNIQRVVPMLLRVTQHPGEDNSDLNELYDRVLQQWSTELTHVANVVGGADVQTKYGGQPGPIYTPYSRARQAAAVRFLNEHAFKTPAFLIDPAITRRLEPSGSLNRVGNAQEAVLYTLLDERRLERLIDYAAVDRIAHKTGRRVVRSPTPYEIDEFLRDLRHGIWSELSLSTVRIGPFRRNLQEAYLNALEGKINWRTAEYGGAVFRRTGDPDLRAAVRGEFIELRDEITNAVNRAGDRDTRLHLLDMKDRIDHILNPAR